MGEATPDPAGAVKHTGKALKAKTSQFAANISPVIREIQAARHTSCNAIPQRPKGRHGRRWRWRRVQARQIADRAE